jgi:hypothetical protein
MTICALFFRELFFFALQGSIAGGLGFSGKIRGKFHVLSHRNLIQYLELVLSLVLGSAVGGIFGAVGFGSHKCR